jgi:hypothetical protein
MVKASVVSGRRLAPEAPPAVAVSFMPRSYPRRYGTASGNVGRREEGWHVGIVATAAGPP